MKNKIIIGSRGSKLSLIYAERAKIELLKRGVCGYDRKQKTVSLSGSYVLNVANSFSTKILTKNAYL